MFGQKKEAPRPKGGRGTMGLNRESAEGLVQLVFHLMVDFFGSFTPQSTHEEDDDGDCQPDGGNDSQYDGQQSAGDHEHHQRQADCQSRQASDQEHCCDHDDPEAPG